MNSSALADLPVVTLVIIAVTVVVSVRAFQHRELQDKLIFCPEWILGRKEYYRLYTSALLHGDWEHLIFNMVSLYLFGHDLELHAGIGRYLLIYFASIVGGSLLSLYLHRHHEYFALGASGGVCGIVFASIFLFPGMRVGSLILPLGIPAWLYAILFLVSEFRGLRSRRSNIGHDAHIGGAIIGLLTTTAMYPEIVRQSPRLYAMVMVLSTLMFVYFWKNPLHLPLAPFFRKSPKGGTGEPTAAPGDDEVDAILEKVSREGIGSLSRREQKILQKAARK